MSISYAVFCLKKKMALLRDVRKVGHAPGLVEGNPPYPAWVSRVPGHPLHPLAGDALHRAAREPITAVHLFFFNDTATTEIYTLSLHDALPIFPPHTLAGGILGKRLATQSWVCHG